MLGVWAETVCSTPRVYTSLNERSKRGITDELPKVANGSDRRIEILKSAAAAFRRRGYHGASVDEIASALEMTKGNLYYYFRNKEEILFACHDYSLDVLLDLMTEVEADSSRPDEKLRRVILAFIHMMLDELQGTALTLDLQALSPPLLKRIIAKRDRFDHGMREIIQQGIDQGLFRPGDPKMIGFAMMGAVNWITKWFDPEGPMTSEEIGQRFADYLVGGLLKAEP
jgi:AcrR family transcriptional regulator